MPNWIHPRSLTVAALIATALSLFAVSAAAAEKPNIVFIISDDHDYEHLGFMGNSYVHTPTLDRLAEAGTLFTTAHLPMSRCHPTLASFLSGRWPHQTGIYYNYGTEKLAPRNSLPNLLKKAGYATYVEGKYWEGDPREMGFTHGAGKTARTFVREGQDDLFAFIDALAGRQPMFIWWAPLIPHTPHNPPQKYLDLYDPAQMPVPGYVKPSSLAPADASSAKTAQPTERKGKRQGKAKQSGKAKRQGFRERELLSYAMEAWLDDGLAQLVDKLERAGQHEKTMYVFVIDNGWCNGLVSKGSPFEKGVRTPIFFSLPGTIPGSQRFDDLVSTLDLYPTILDYAGVAVPESAAGRSHRPRIEGRPFEPREALFGAIYPAFVTKGDERPERDVYALYVRTEKWKYILFVQDVVPERNGDYFRIQSIETDYPARKAGEQDLYDLESDPYEQRNLAGDPAQKNRLAELKERVLAWWRETGGKPLAVR
jgi:arylsulfatase A-like enzyme